MLLRHARRNKKRADQGSQSDGDHSLPFWEIQVGSPWTAFLARSAARGEVCGTVVSYFNSRDRLSPR